MDIDHFASIVRSLSATPSRRAAIRGLAGLTAGSFLAPFSDSTTAKRRGGKKGHRKKRKHKPQVCSQGGMHCDRECGDGTYVCGVDGRCCRSDGCFQACGCCPEFGTECCAGPLNHLCHNPIQEQCCPVQPGGLLVGVCPRPLVCKGSSIVGAPWCCESGSVECLPGQGCCPQGNYCCDGRCCDNPECQEDPAHGKHCSTEVFGQAARIA
jgi:hypothetical protein